MAIEQKRTFCRVCEPACGLIATVDDGELVKLQADKDHPISKGFVCNKGIYGADIHNDPDRLTHPLRRCADGTFEQIDWDTALSEISARLLAIKNRYGDTALGSYTGNPGVYNTLTGPSQGSFLGQLGVRKFFGSGTQDCANKFAGGAAVFGTRTLHPIPDIEHADMILILGENPAVSHMSFVSIPHAMQHLQQAEQRGAKVRYVNPREIESASIAGSVIKIKPDTDVYLLAAMLEALLAQGWHDDIYRHGNNVEALADFVRQYPAERVADITGIDPGDIRRLAADFAAADAACIHMSTGVNMGRQGTLAYWLLHMVSLATGNLGRRGGNFYSLGFYERAAASGRKFPNAFMQTEFGTVRQPGAGLTLPGNLMAQYITHPDEPIKAMFVSSGNPVLSIAGEADLRDALESLELLVCIDIYRNATAEYADYVLPAAGAFERADINLVGLGMQYQPSIQFTDAVVAPKYERREDWWIWEQLARHMGYDSAMDTPTEPDMWGRIDAMLRSRGHSMTELREAGIIALERARPDHLFDQVAHEDQLIDCCPEIFAPALERMANLFKELAAEPASQLKLISKRDDYMINSWYANVDKLKRGKRATNYLFMHPGDAESRQLADGDEVQVSNSFGELVTQVKYSADLLPGVVAMTHGWGHQRSRGMRIAQERPGVNCNVLLPSGPDSFEPLSSQSHMTGIPVEVRKAQAG